jgi:hypothetical protein
MRNHRFCVTVAVISLSVLTGPALAQHDPGVRGGFKNTAGALEQRGIHRCGEL